MSIVAICAVGILTAVTALMLRSQSPHSAMLLSVGAGAVIILSLLKNIPELMGGVNAIIAESGIDSSDVVILLKAIGICFVTEFTCDCVTEAGLMSLSANISFAGKILVLFTALPLFDNILSALGALGGG